MEAPAIILPKVRENTPYWFKCEVVTDAYLPKDRLIAKLADVAERFVRDMHQQGYEYVVGSKWKVEGPIAPVKPVTIRVPRQLTARQMEPYVRNGARFLDRGSDSVALVRSLREYDRWVFFLKGMFYRPQILTEYPDAHEEEK